MAKNSSEKTKKFLVYFMAIIMVSSVFGVVFFGFSGAGSQTSKYKGYKFIFRGDAWSTKAFSQTALFSYLPQDVENVNVSPDSIGLLKQKLQIDTTADSNGTFIQEISLAQFQMGASMQPYNVYIRNGFTSKNDFNDPVINCSIATPFVPVIYFKEGKDTMAYTEGSCIIAESGNAVDFIRLKDRLLYGMFDII